MRLSGLSPGAKLELVLLSRSPSVVSVALQLPESEAFGLPSGRLVEKYPSNTTLWMILRKSEHMAPNRNYTQRGKTKVETGQGGFGRLYHETPVLSNMGRDFTSFTDLQKTLAQLGFNRGSVLLRLSFRISETPLEEAMAQIEQYFKAVEGKENSGAHSTSITSGETVPDSVQPILSEENDAKTPSEPTSAIHENPPPDETSNIQPESSYSITEEPPLPTATSSPSQRPVTVFRPPSTSTPRAAKEGFNEADYEPTVHHAKQHQARLLSAGRNKTLLSDKELAEKEKVKAQKLADIKEIEIKIKFPNEFAIGRTFSSIDTARSLYDFARESLRNENEPFLLSFTSNDGTRTIKPDSAERLVADLGMSGRTLVTVRWDKGASVETRTKPILKEHLLEEAKEIEIPSIPEIDAPEEPVEKISPARRTGNSSSGNKNKMSKILGRLSKK
ncbi:MAG: hypothetical protein Q9170_000076 [Blastenia crenularia]